MDIFKSIREFISNGFLEATRKQRKFEIEFQRTSKAIEKGKNEMQERAKHRKLIREINSNW